MNNPLFIIFAEFFPLLSWKFFYKIQIIYFLNFDRFINEEIQLRQFKSDENSGVGDTDFKFKKIR